MRKTIFILMSAWLFSGTLCAQVPRWSFGLEAKGGLASIRDWENILDISVIQPAFTYEFRGFAELFLGGHVSMQAGLSVDAMRQKMKTDISGLAMQPTTPPFIRNTATIYSVSMPLRLLLHWRNGKVGFVAGVDVAPLYSFAISEQSASSGGWNGPWNVTFTNSEFGPLLARTVNVNLGLIAGIETFVLTHHSVRILPFLDYQVLNYLPGVQFNRWRAGLGLSFRWLQRVDLH